MGKVCLSIRIGNGIYDRDILYLPHPKNGGAVGP